MKKVILAVACAAMVMVSCNNKGKEIDQNIDKFESIVNEYCTALESGDMAAAEAAGSKLEEVTVALKDTTAMSEAQKTRLKTIGQKMAGASAAALSAGAEALDQASQEAGDVVEQAAQEAGDVVEQAAQEAANAVEQAAEEAIGEALGL